MEYLRLKSFAQRSASEGRIGERKPLSPNSPSSPFSIAPSPTSTSNLSPNSTLTPPPSSLTTRPTSPLPNTDPLPTDPGLLEGLLNHHASQLKKLADRVENINEWIEMDGIVLARLVDDVRHRVEREEGERMGAVVSVALTNLCWRIADDRSVQIDVPAPSPATPLYRGVHAPQRPRTPVVHFEIPEGRKVSESEMSAEESVNSNNNVRDIRERIRSMKRWRRELERSVFWQREEYFRIEKAMGKKKPDAELGGVVEGHEGGGVGGFGAWGVGGKTWEKGSGRLPTQVEWEVMFGPLRLGWDEKGARPKF